MMKFVKKGKRLVAVVVAAGRMAKTVTVEVRRFVKHPQYGKYEVKRKKYLAHDETGQAKVGDKVQIQATRPLSRRKHFVLV